MNRLRITARFHGRRGRYSKKELRSGEAGPSSPAGRVPRVARLMALALRCEQLVRDGLVADYAELARLGHVTRARMTQITNLLYLAPDLQEAILFLPPVEKGRDPITERDLRPIAAEISWERQRELWREMIG